MQEAALDVVAPVAIFPQLLAAVDDAGVEVQHLVRVAFVQAEQEALEAVAPGPHLQRGC